jgi:hypothetical protein
VASVSIPETGASCSGQETERWMRAIAAGLTAAGLAAQVNETRGVLDITATLQRPGGKSAEVVVDEDGYVELRYGNRPGAAPDQVTTVIVRALAAIAAAQRS